MHTRFVLKVPTLAALVLFGTGTAVAQNIAVAEGSEQSVAQDAATANSNVPPSGPTSTSSAGVPNARGPESAEATAQRTPSTAAVDSTPKTTDASGPLTSKLVVEFGLLDPLAHKIQFGRSGTEFDYVKDGGQDVLFPTSRLSVEASWKRRHTVIFLYQPIDLRTQETLRQDLLVDNVRFPAGTPMDFRYGFDFYRVSYLYNFVSCREKDELSLGGSLQLRNAIIDFTSADGLLRRSNRDVGPVPALKSRGRWYPSDRAWLGYEVDGMYAPVKYINGGKSDVVGAILDLSVRGGIEVSSPLDVFVNFRYLGGGASGTSKSDAARGPGDGYTSNWLHFISTTVGVEVKLDQLFKR